jgi:iron complex transport system ATP-binding protein
MLSIQGVTGGYNGRNIVKDISFQVHESEFFGILGPNGSGKTTLLKMISGILPAKKGVISIKNQSIQSYTPKERAKFISVLPQLSSESFSYTVEETVMLGRYAHQTGWFQTSSEEDEKIVKEVMIQTGVFTFRNRSLHELSGGEQQRVFLAQALAQQPKILLLDELTNHLDLAYQKDLLDLIKKMTREKKLAVISVFHDINLASLYCDRILLLDNGKIKMMGTPSEVITEEHIHDVYETKVKKHDHPTMPKPLLTFIPEQMTEESLVEIDEKCLKRIEDGIVLESPIPLKTMSSAVLNSGVGWFQFFVDQYVSRNAISDNHHEEMASFLTSKGFPLSNTAGMMTTVTMKDDAWEYVKGDGFSIFIVVIAGIEKALDMSKRDIHLSEGLLDSIHTWIFINGELSDEAYIQAIATSTEAKVKVLQDLKIQYSLTETNATGALKDRILIAATQKGTPLQYAGTNTPLGKAIEKGVGHCIRKVTEKLKGRTLT